MISEYLYDNNSHEESVRSLATIFKNHNLTQDAILVKVNWSSNKRAYFTDLQTFCFFYEALRLAYSKAEIIVVESYSYDRNDPELEFFQDQEMQRKEIIRENERKFMAQQGFEEFFLKNGIRYINVTEECWAGKTVDKNLICSDVKDNYSYEIKHPELLEMIPEVLYKYKGKSLISLAKTKGIILPGFLFFTLSQKNLFGLIPNTCRRHYHGKPNLVDTITDMNVIYKSIFDVVGVCESVFNTLFIGKQPYVIENSGCALISRDLVTLDATIINSLSFNPHDRKFILATEKVFNPVNKNEWYSTIIREKLYPLIDEKINIVETKNSKEVVDFRI